MATQRTLVRGGHVLSMDPAIGELPQGDVLIEDGVITAVAPSLGEMDAEVIDAAGHIVAPGLIDTHRHTWQTQMRALCTDWTLTDYLFGIRFSVSPAYTPRRRPPRATCSARWMRWSPGSRRSWTSRTATTPPSTPTPP